MAVMTWKKEVSFAAILLLVGMLGLPLAIYAVGQQIIGDYAPDAQAADLIAAIWSALMQGRWAAWLLVLSPYLVISLLRLARAMLRAR
jgi:hypothetical protein